MATLWVALTSKTAPMSRAWFIVNAPDPTLVPTLLPGYGVKGRIWRVRM